MIKKLFCTITSTALLCCSFASHAGVYVEIPGIPGQAQRVGFEGAIDAYGVSGSFADKSCGDILIVKAIDSASPLLIAAAVEGQLFSEITVSYQRDSGDATFPVLTLRLLNGQIKSVETAVDEGDDVTVEEISVRAATIIVEYQIQDDDHSAGDVVATTLDCRNKK